MQQLVELLQKIENDSTLPDDKYAILYGEKEIQALAMDLFIDKEGNPLFEKMDELQKLSGYYIFPGERDRCGWLTACLQTKKGVIVFG